MSSTSDILSKILDEFRTRGFSQISGYNRFGYIRETGSAVFISRETGKDTKVPFSKIEQGIDAVKSDPSIYNAGPSKLRAYGITHITSPIWSLLHLVSLSEY